MGGIPHAGSQQTWNSFTAPQNSPAFSFCNDKLPYSCVVLCLVTQLCPTLLDPTDCSPPRILCPRGFSRQEYWSGLPCPPSGNLPNPGTKPRSPALHAGSFPSEPPGKPMYVGVQNWTAKDLQTRGKTEQKHLSDFVKSSDTKFNFINSVLTCEKTKSYSLRNG